jgi:hypothetical protein
MTMRLIAQEGVRLDRSLSDLDRMILLIRMTPYHELSQRDRQRLKLLLDLQHREREAIRFPTFDEFRAMM